MSTNSFQVVITNQLRPDQDKNLITQKLATLFKIDEPKAAQLLLKPRTVIKDNLDEAAANKYLIAIRQTGAHCEVINKKEAVDLPQIVEPQRIDPVTPQPRTSSPAATNTRQEAPLSLVAREAKIKQETQEKLSTLEHAGVETLCPQCGTIRGSADAVCLHCGYDPLMLTQHPGRKKILIVAGTIIVIMAIALFVSLPYINQYLAQKKLGDDLNLAFDIRNQVSAFIEDTGFFANQNMDANLPAHISNDSIESIVVGNDAVITITLNADTADHIPGQTIIFTPKLFQGKIIWNCMQGTLANEFRPEICKK
jgi:hypothetical protein